MPHSYVHGIMDGEIIKELWKGNYELQELKIG